MSGSKWLHFRTSRWHFVAMLCLFPSGVSSWCNIQCQNGGTCKNIIHIQWCECTSGFWGLLCEKIKYCDSHSQCNGGKCASASKSCTCPDGKFGNNCEFSCTTLCQNGGTCQGNSNGDQYCACTSDYWGTNCEERVYCIAHDQCNGGTCTIASRICTCPQGKFGNNCEFSCTRSCQNGGTCQGNSDGDQYCACTYAYWGADCQTPCTRDCQNGGTCKYKSNGGQYCTCPSDYGGHYCERRLYCNHGSQCNGGTCSTSGICSCPDGQYGNNCEYDSRRCTSNPCQNQGQCSNDTASPLCECQYGYSAKYCETHLCDATPCLNGATCHPADTSPGYTCSCTSGYSGERCETDIDPCDPFPCSNAGGKECIIRSPTEYSCKCVFGYGGKKCEYDESPNMKCFAPVKGDFNMTADSFVNENFSPDQGYLLNPNSAWCAAHDQSNPVFTIIFEETVTIRAVATRGDPTANNYVTSYKLQGRKENGVLDWIAGGQTIPANTDRNSIKRYQFTQTNTAIHLLIYVQSFSGEYACMRIEVYGCMGKEADPVECLFSTFGIAAPDRFPNSSFSSSSHHETFESYKARLRGPQAWCPADDDSHPILEITLPKVNQEIVGVITQGLETSGDVAYTLSYKLKDQLGTLYRAMGKIFLSGNPSGVEPTTHFLDKPISLFTQGVSLKFVPQVVHNRGCLRVELISCEWSDPCLSQPCRHGGTCLKTSTTTFQCECREGFGGTLCENGLCYQELSVHNEDVFVSTDIHNYPRGQVRYRLNQVEPWCAKQSDTTPWLKLSFHAVMKVRSIAIGGHSDKTTKAFVKRFGVFSRIFKDEEWSPISVNGSTVLHGTMKSGRDEVEYIFDNAISAFEVRFKIFEYSDESLKCTRINVRGCDPGYCSTTSNNPCSNSHSCTRFDRKPYKCSCLPGFGGSLCKTDLCEVAGPCHYNATCGAATNYACACNEGLQGNGTYCADFCELAGPCHLNASCGLDTNYTCVCHEGFQGNGSFCEHFCEINGPCDMNANCNKTTNYTCVCNEGFAGNGLHCYDICEEAGCHVNSTCNQLTNYSCVCNDGFKGNGTDCRGLCELAGCHANASCEVVNNVANCTCDYGYNGNGTYCTAFYEWGNWSSCDVSCGNGIERRTRECIAPGEPSCTGETTQERICVMPPCAVHGNWSEWGPWATCSVTCGSGFYKRARTCTNPKPEHGGDDCVGVSEDFDDCAAGRLCSGEAGYGEWTNWTLCSKTCDSGYQNRTRTCKNELLGCTAESLQTKPCLLMYCPMNGSYTEWGNWSECSESCGNGEQFRERNCSNPRPAHGGAECVGPAKETKECILELFCRGDFGYGEWSAWSSCTSTCSTGTQSRSRECIATSVGNTLCRGDSDETRLCFSGSCPVNGGWTNWTDWTSCSASCDSGQKEKRRFCTNPLPQYGGGDCSGRGREISNCIISNCTGSENYSPWSSWSVCSVSCGSGSQSKTRFCLNRTGFGCNLRTTATQECLLPDCPVHGGFTQWTSWSICSVTCGSGTTQRMRECTNPEPANNGSDCLGPAEESKVCTMPEICPDQLGFTTWTLWSECSAPCSFGNTSRSRNCSDATLETCNGGYNENMTCYAGPCPVHGIYSIWSSWSSCRGYCGSGLRNRSRTCTNPKPAHGGSGCSGADSDVEDCQHAVLCTGEGGFNQWSSWTVCTQTCGSSTQIRTRTCQDGAPPEECSAASIQTKPCDFGECPVHGGWSSWSFWSTCSSSCGSSAMLRKRTCTNPSPSYGGLPCYGNTYEYDTCVMPESCPGDDEYSNWGRWGACSTTCGEGTRRRSRYCIVLPTYPPSGEPYCTSTTDQYIKCFEEPCPVNGSFTPWTGWSACTTTCGFGIQKRYRNCTNPSPLFGGYDCVGALNEEKECENVTSCPDDSNFSPWTSWEPCTTDCEGITYKTRTCLAENASECLSLVNATIECNSEICPVDGGWSTWTSWSSCSKTCGHQEEVRTRVCNNPLQKNGGAYCSGHDIEVMPCSYYDYVPCPDPPPAAWSDWSWWTVCNESCGGGRQHRHRLCNNPPPAPGAIPCVGEAKQEENCNVHPCPIHGNFSLWTEWTECSLECGNGTQVRGRLCVNPSPKYGGRDCEGQRLESRNCNTDPCPIHGRFTLWSPWSYCSKPCNTGASERTRSCTNPTPMFGGRNCSGESLESNVCHTHSCIPVNLKVNVTFKDVTLISFLADRISFGNNVRNLIDSAYPESNNGPVVTLESCSGDNNNKVQCMLNLLYSSLAEDELVVLQEKLCNDSSRTDLHGLSSFKIISCPLTVTISAITSTSIDVQWTALPLPCQTFQTKFVTGYVIFYKEDGADGYQKVTKKSFVRRTILNGLKKFTKYQIVVSPFSENGNGVPSLPVRNATLEDVPSVAPVITETHATSPISLNLTWTAVDPSYWHGIPRGYCVTYRARGSIITRSLDITDLTQLNVTISGLRPFSLYYINVAAKTSPGCGAEASVQVLTREDAPDGPPQDITARNTSSTSILVQWDYVLPTERNGVILGYRVSYIKYGEVKSVGVQGFRTKQVEITGLDIFTEYSFHVLAYNRIGDGPESSEVIAMTDESTPSEAPLLVKAVNTSSSSIILQWQGISPENSNGILLGYRIYYRPANTKWESKVAEVQSNSTFELELTNLFLWWLYEIQIGAYTRVGTGVKTNASVQTDEDFPSRYPENIRGIALTTTSMSLEWDPVLPGFVHGNLLGYNLTIRQTEDFDNVIVQTILPPYERSYYVQGLKKFTNYTIWVRAINSKGQGAVYFAGHINSTGEDGMLFTLIRMGEGKSPEIPPEDITVSTLEDISVINIEWTRIPQEFHNGILRGYYVEYTATVLAGQFIATEDRVVQSVRIRGNRYATVLRDLDPGSTYEIKVFGYTIKNGTKSNGTLGETCRCPKYIRTNWWVMPPYTNTSNPASPGGIFFTVAETVLDGLCGICENGHGRTEICFEEGCDKRRRRRSTSNSYQKNSLQDVVSDIDGNTEISFPVQGNKYMTTYAGVFPYISVVDAPGSAYFTVKNVPSTAEVVVNAVIACMPLVVLMILFAWLAGIIIWFLERKENSEHFPESFTSGVPEGFWWAFVSMTTVGYGDRSPVTIPGRLFAIAWILMGLVIISVVTGGIVTSITSVLVVQEDKIYGAQVGAIVNSSEYRKAVRQNADVVGYNNMEEIINAMKNKEIAGALIDMYAAATKKHLFEMDKDIQMNRMIEYPTGCGIVLSGNMAKAAPLFYEALATYKGEVSRIVEENTDTISQDRNEAEEAKEKSSGLFDPTAEAFRGSFNVTIGLLVAVIAAGLTWHYGVYRRRKVRRKWELDELRDCIPSLRVCEFLKSKGRNQLKEFTKTLQKDITMLKKKHELERKKTLLCKMGTETRKGTSIFGVNIRRSVTRVSPKINEGMGFKGEKGSPSETSSRPSSHPASQQFKSHLYGHVSPAEGTGSNELAETLSLS